MTDLFNCNAADPTIAGSQWVYWRPMIDGISELGLLRGRGSELAMHFHEEFQVTFVLAGRRALQLGDAVIELTSRRCACIPAWTPHRSLEGSSDLVSVNAYLPAGDYAVSAMQAEIEREWRMVEGFEWRDLAALIRAHKGGCAADRSIALRPDRQESVSRRASRTGQSREGFSRAFAKRYGMPPHAFELIGRLNRARDLLRAGEAVAATAAETGFADQSHLGRWFRRAFGATPGRYRLG
ncbi:transcriptional regulator, AraC family [Methylocella silvestris BL2]|uniref:Transcriptional regulator, AraC family n=1 Tax=Methylocella silvestris (strain DSM 15510 / CIP 108128 / LMG 27833 / NCIMB 13906 / BL2) TaxID=395965 RepID=B8EQX0_METSB|nr:helix-turn-helix domain-containing protein [Methylocella silvestris]ACK49391.1 transcriptional regulator, AraC family [Methylocella silvestris BL2]